MRVRAERENQAENVSNKEHDGDFQTQVLLANIRMIAHDVMKDRWHNQTDSRKREHRRAEHGSRCIEALLRILEAASENARAEHQQHIADDRAGDRSLDHIEQARAQSHERDNQLRRIAERRIEQAAEAFAQLLRQMLSRPSHPSSQWNNR